MRCSRVGIIAKHTRRHVNRDRHRLRRSVYLMYLRGRGSPKCLREYELYYFARKFGLWK